MRWSVVQGLIVLGGGNSGGQLQAETQGREPKDSARVHSPILEDVWQRINRLQKQR